MSITDMILCEMANFEYQAKLTKLYEEYKKAAPLLKYKLYMRLKHYGVEVQYDY